MEQIPILLEIGRKKVFATVLEWPGWARAGKDEAAALQALLDSAQRYAAVAAAAGLPFTPPAGLAALAVVERAPGDAATDFGAPGGVPALDKTEVDPAELERLLALLRASWQALDAAAAAAQGKTLRRGPRGGGRDLDRILDHVFESERAYLRRLAGSFKADSAASPAANLAGLRAAVVEALQRAVAEGLPESGPRGGQIWSVRTYVRRAAWHALDHAWEIEDRLA